MIEPPGPRIPRRLDPYKRRPIEAMLPARWRARRQRRRARLARMTRAQRVWRRLGLNLTWLLGFVALVMATAVVLFYTLSNVPKPEDLPVPQAATIEYSNGATLTRIGTNRQVVALSEVPQQVRWGVAAAADPHLFFAPLAPSQG